MLYATQRITNLMMYGVGSDTNDIKEHIKIIITQEYEERTDGTNIDLNQFKNMVFINVEIELARQLSINRLHDMERHVMADTEIYHEISKFWLEHKLALINIRRKDFIQECKIYLDID